MKIKEIVKELESLASPSLQESYDNAGLIVGNKDWECKGILTCLDSTEEIIDEAINKGCNLVVAHHPIVFSGLKKITGKNYIERVIIKAIKNDVAIYAIHTNLDNIQSGVNFRIGQKLGLNNLRILAPKKGELLKLTTFIPSTSVEEVKEALFNAGAGKIGNYDQCSFQVKGSGNFRALKGANPTLGNIGTQETVDETKVELVFAKHLKSKVISALNNAHPYEEVAYDIIQLENNHKEIGAGMIGELPNSVDVTTFLEQVKKTFNANGIRFTKPISKTVKKVAFCGGSGSFLLNHAIGNNADIFITGDFKYHQFFDADSKIIIADIGHYESEQYTIELLSEYLTEKFPNFAVLNTSINTNPINYL